jgi:hypothetical protein
MKNSSDTIWNRTRNLPTCKAVPQPTAPPRIPHQFLYITRILENLLLGRSAVEGYSLSAGEEILRPPTHSNTWNEQTNCYVRNSRSLSPVFASFKGRFDMSLPFTTWYISADEWRREPVQITEARRSRRGLEDGFFYKYFLSFSIVSLYVDCTN